MPHPPGSSIIRSAANSTALPLLVSEQVIFDVHPSLTVLIVQAIGLLLLAGIVDVIFWRSRLLTDRLFLIIPLAIALFVIVILLVAWVSTIYLLTNLRVEVRRGILIRSVQNISTASIESVKTEVGTLGLVLGYGDVKTQSAADQFIIKFRTISRPFDRAQQIQDARR